MAILQISKIQQRAGNLVDLPQLDEAEFGWASDNKRLFIGKTTPNENVEVLTGYSSIYFSQIDGSVGNLNITALSLANGEILAYDGASWVNKGGVAGGLITLGSVANVKITGGTNGYVLQTDGTGNLSWTAQTGGSAGNGIPGGSDSQIQYNSAGNFAGGAGFTWNNASNLLTVTGNVLSGNVNGNHFGNGFGLSALVGANVTGNVASATTAGTVTTAAQPNITSVGTLTSLSVTGNISGSNLIANSYTIRSVSPILSAAGSSQGTATILTKEINVVNTVVSGANGVQLPAASPGMTIYITNTTANTLNVYPASGAAIGTLSANAALAQSGNGATIQFIAPTTTQWYTVGATYS